MNPTPTKEFPNEWLISDLPSFDRDQRNKAQQREETEKRKLKV